MIDPLRLLARDRWLVLGCVLLGLAGGIAVHALTPREYAAQVTVRFARLSEVTGRPTFNPIESLLPDPTANTRVQEIRSDDGLRAVARASGTSIDALRSRLETLVDVSSNNVLVTVTARSPAQALREARAIARTAVARTRAELRLAFDDAIRRIGERVAEDPQAESGVAAQQLARLRFLSTGARPANIVDPGTLPEEATLPDAVFPGALGAVFGLMLGLGLAALRDVRDRRLRRVEDVLEATTLPALAVLGALPGPRQPPTLEQRLGADRLRLEVTTLAPAPAVVVVVRAGGGDSAAVAMAIAAAQARRSRPVVLVDGDLRSGDLSGRLGLAAGAPGLSDVLRGTLEPGGALTVVALADGQEGGVVKVPVLPAGTLSGWPDRLLASAALDRCLATIRGTEALVVVDAGEALGTADALEWAARADLAILAVVTGQVTGAEVAAASRALAASPARAGLVVSGTDDATAAAGAVVLASS